MKRIVSSTATNIFYALKSVKFWAAVILEVFILYIYSDTNVIWGQKFEMYYILFWTLEAIPEEFVMAVSALPAVTLFADEWCGGRFIYSYTRLNGKGYAVTLILSVFLISVLVTLFSMGLFIGILSPSHPMAGDRLESSLLQIARGYANGGLLQHGHFFAYYLITLLRQACYMGIFAAIAAAASIWISNSYVAIVFPVFLYVVINDILVFVNVPGVILPVNVYRHTVYLSKMFDPDLKLSENNFTVISMLYPFIYTLMVLVLLVVLSYFWIRRKYRSSSDLR